MKETAVELALNVRVSNLFFSLRCAFKMPNDYVNKIETKSP